MTDRDDLLKKLQIIDNACAAYPGNRADHKLLESIVVELAQFVISHTPQANDDPRDPARTPVLHNEKAE